MKLELTRVLRGEERHQIIPRSVVAVCSVQYCWVVISFVHFCPKTTLLHRVHKSTDSRQHNNDSMTSSTSCKLVVTYGIGGLSDVGRHAILAALKNVLIDKITVITKHSEQLNETDWNWSFPSDHTLPGKYTNPFNDPKLASRLEMVSIDSWTKEQPDLARFFVGAAGVVSCLGHRQPGWKNKELITRGLIAYDGNKKVIAAMSEAKVSRVVVITSVALMGDKSWSHWASKVMGCLFKTFQRKAGTDLIKMEAAYVDSTLDYLFVRPVGMGETQIPVGRYYLQVPGNNKSINVYSGGEIVDGIVGGNMAKWDVARFMVNKVIQTTLHRKSQVVGSKPGTPM